MSEMRLQRFLAQAGVAARRKAEALITDGRVKVNDEVVTVLGTKVDPESDRVSVDGQAVRPLDYVYVVLNKPKACITAVSDPQGRRTVMEYVPGLAPGVNPVGRLDFFSEGVLLLTNDGSLSAALQSPKHHVEKTYHVKIHGTVTDAEIESLRAGIRIGPGEHTRPAQVDRLKSKSKHGWLVVTLTEGKSRQIHRMMESLGHRVTKLQRVAFGNITYHGLRVGDARELTQGEVDELRALAGLAKSPLAVSRGKWSVKREETDASRRASDRSRSIPTPGLTPGGSRKATARLRAKFATDDAGPRRHSPGGKPEKPRKTARSTPRRGSGRSRPPSRGKR